MCGQILSWNNRLCAFLPLLSDIFSQISDSSGTMVFAKFDQFLREVLKLPTAVFEGPSFGYTEHSVRTCFPQQVSVHSLPSKMRWLPLHSPVHTSCVSLTCPLPEEDIAKHLLGRDDGGPSPTVPRLATSHAPTGQCRERYVLSVLCLFTSHLLFLNMRPRAGPC